MYNIINNGYETYSGSECLMACFQNIIKYNRLEIDESDVFILGNGFNIFYHTFNKDEAGIKIFGGVNNSVYEFCKNYGIDIIKKESVSDVDAENDLTCYISRNYPVTVKADPGYLDYNLIYTNGYGLTHYINILDYNREKGLAFISDGFVPTYPTSTYHDWYDYSILKKSRNAKENLYIVFNFNSCKTSDLTYKMLDEKVYVIIKESLANYLNNNKKNCGAKALIQFAEDIPNLMEVFGDKYSDEMFKLNYQLKTFGLISSKSLLYKAFRRLEHDFKSTTPVFSDSILEIVNEWNRIGLLIVRAGIEKKASSLLSLSERVRLVTMKEVQIFESILSRLKI